MDTAEAAMRLHFVSATGGSAFMHELLQVVAWEIRAMDTTHRFEEITVSEGDFPDGDDAVYVVVPHEFFQLAATPSPSRERLQRTIGFCVEHPGTRSFDVTVELASELAYRVSINDESTVLLNRLGLPTERYELGYSECWDRWQGANHERPLDVCYLGTDDRDRSRKLAIDSAELDHSSVLWATPPHEWKTRPRADFLMGEEKLHLLATTKVLLNLHRDHSTSLEWLRVLEAICNGCVVVSEHSPALSPLRPGVDAVFGRPRTLHHLTKTLLGDPPRLHALRASAYELIRSNSAMARSSALLADIAEQVADGTVSRRSRTHVLHRGSVAWPLDLSETVVDDSLAHRSTGAGNALTLSLKSEHVKDCRSAGSLDVLIWGASHVAEVTDLINRLLVQCEGLDVHIHVEVDEADAAPATSPVAVHSRGTRSPSHLSDALVGQLDGEHVLILSSSDWPADHAVGRLRDALLQGSADAAYGMVITAGAAIESQWPFEPDRIARSEYIVEPCLWRRGVLISLCCQDRLESGTVTVPELWRRLAASGGSAAFVQRPVIRQGWRMEIPSSRPRSHWLSRVQHLRRLF
jgi:hypothetical protein